MKKLAILTAALVCGAACASAQTRDTLAGRYVRANPGGTLTLTALDANRYRLALTAAGQPRGPGGAATPADCELEAEVQKLNDVLYGEVSDTPVIITIENNGLRVRWPADEGCGAGSDITGLYRRR